MFYHVLANHQIIFIFEGLPVVQRRTGQKSRVSCRRQYMDQVIIPLVEQPPVVTRNDRGAYHDVVVTGSTDADLRLGKSVGGCCSICQRDNQTRRWNNLCLKQFETKADARPQTYLIIAAQRKNSGDPLAIEINSISAVEVFNNKSFLPLAEAGVLPGYVRIVNDDSGGLCPADN